MNELISQPWHWSFSGIMLVIVMVLLIYYGKRFGVSSSFRTLCTIGGAGKLADYFRYDWRSHEWLLLFVAGSIIGGVIAGQLFPNPDPVQVSEMTVATLAEMGVSTAGNSLVPESLFTIETLLSVKGLVLFVVGGFLIGFGTRYAGGCTSGHAITGLANLQLPSLVAVIGFFIGGLLMAHIILPKILAL